MNSIEDKVAWVTGAGTGIGRGGAVALAKAGAKVVLSGRREAPLEDAQKRIADAGGKAVIELLDISDADAVYAVADRIKERHGRLDILVNSAGLNVPKRRWKDIDANGWHTVVDIDLNGAFYCSHAALRMMREQRDGLIINISSLAGRRIGSVSGAAYTAAKHGVNAMCESINLENCHLGIRACAICPGDVATEILDKRPFPPSPEARARMIQEEEMADTILFVAQMPPHVCINELTITPTWNLSFIGGTPDREIPRDD